MKILHTSDWHLGHRLQDFSQTEEQQLFLQWLKQYIVEHKIDVLLIAGDVFDTGAPSNQSLQMYYDFLVNLKQTSCQSVIITGGNHDSPGTLNAPKQLLDALSIKVVGKATEQVENEVFEININNEKLIVAAVPYLRDQDIRRAVAGESFDELTERYKTALVNHYNKIAAYCNQINTSKAPVIAMGHLFAVGGQLSDSEQNIYVGNLGHIGADDFPDSFDYIALGHLHRPQTVGGREHIRYAGSPYILSFSEIHYPKQLLEVSIEDNAIQSIKNIDIPRFREIYSLSGTKQECLDRFPEMISNSYGLKPWVEIVLDENSSVKTDDLRVQAEANGFEILKITLINFDRRLIGIEEQLKQSQSIKELKPDEVFKLKCEEQSINLDERPEILDAFSEILQQVKDQ